MELQNWKEELKAAKLKREKEREKERKERLQRKKDVEAKRNRVCVFILFFFAVLDWYQQQIYVFIQE